MRSFKIIAIRKQPYSKCKELFLQVAADNVLEDSKIKDSNTLLYCCMAMIKLEIYLDRYEYSPYF